MTLLLVVVFGVGMLAGGEVGRSNAGAPASLVRKGVIFHDDRYYPYSAIANVEDDRVHLAMDAENAHLLEWKKRPDYEDHLGDPLQLFYDRGHDVHNPFDETNPTTTYSSDQKE